MKSIRTYLILIITTLTIVVNAQKNVGIGTSTPDASAILELNAVDKGFLIPRLDATQMTSIASPQQGLMVYNTSDSCFWFYKNNGWLSLCNQTDISNAWNLKGNAGTTPSADFIGTTDGNDWVVRTNNIERMRVLSTGNIGIGTTNPSYALHVMGKLKTDGITETSDLRFKKNIITIDNPLSKVESLRGVYFNWRTDEFKEREFDTKKQIGLIAQEVEEILPELIQTDSEGYKSVEYSKVTALLIEAIKELKNENNSLRISLEKSQLGFKNNEAKLIEHETLLEELKIKFPELSTKIVSTKN